MIGQRPPPCPTPTLTPAPSAAGVTAEEDPGTPSEASQKSALAPVARDRVSLGGVEVSPLGIGAWAWGDELFWEYSDSMDGDLQEASGTKSGGIE